MRERRGKIEGASGWLVVVAAMLLVVACGKKDTPGTGANNDEVLDGGEDAGGGDDVRRPDAAEVELDVGVDAAADGGGGADASADTGADADLGPTSYDPAVTSGTRLLGHYVEAGDGAAMTLGLWDSELEMHCDYGTAVDGALRCLPRDLAPLVYLDAGCLDQVIFQNSSSCDDSDYAADADTGDIYRATAVPAVLGSFIYVRAGGSCVAVPVDPDDPDLSVWTVEKLESARFVKGTMVDEARTGGMVARYTDGEDGSRILQESRDSVRGHVCVFDDPSGRCASGTSTRTLFFDAACTEAALEIDPDRPPGLVYTGERNVDGCEIGRTYHIVGDRVASPTVFREGAPGTCVETTHFNNRVVHRSNGVVLLSDLPQATVRLEGMGPIQARRWVDADGAPLGVAQSFWDVGRDEVCRPAVREDNGAIVCLPRSGEFADDVYADATCMDPGVGTSYCALPPRLVAVVDSDSCVPGLETVSRVAERGAEIIVAYEKAGAVCTAVGVPDEERWYELGDDAIDTLPVLERKTDEVTP